MGGVIHVNVDCPCCTYTNDPQPKVYTLAFNLGKEQLDTIHCDRCSGFIHMRATKEYVDLWYDITPTVKYNMRTYISGFTKVVPQKATVDGEPEWVV